MIWRKVVETALQRGGGLGTLSEIYVAVENIRRSQDQPLPESWKAIVRRELEHNSSDSESFKKKHDLFYSVRGIGGGVWGLRSLEAPPPFASDLNDPGDPAKRIETYRILRETQLAKRIKKLHGNACQICGLALELANGITYAEAHHIKPLGRPHNGPDIPENIIVLCPTHHVLCDYGAIRLSINTINVKDGHRISTVFIDYHNSVIHESCKTASRGTD